MLLSILLQGLGRCVSDETFFKITNIQHLFIRIHFNIF